MDPDEYVLERSDFFHLIDTVNREGYALLGPKLQDGVIVIDTIHKEDDLPIGWMDEQRPGSYRVKRRSDAALFGYNLGPHSWKKYLFPPEEKLYTIQRKGGALSVIEEALDTKKRAFLAVRACEIEAIKIQDKVFTSQKHVSERYSARRENILIIAVSCTRHVATCFCTAMDTGPEAKEGYDLALTEVIEMDRHYFLMKIGSQKGALIAKSLPLKKATVQQSQKGHELIDHNAATMQKEIDKEAVRDMLKKSWEYKRYSEVAKRCVSCGNCTMACPTCFCTTHEETIDLSGESSKGLRRWESCFNLSHSYIHGGSVRPNTHSMYRQWLTHKFSTWWDQFGLSGCVGCGRCIAWCPVGIDVREELVALQKEHDENGE